MNQSKEPRKPRGVTYKRNYYGNNGAAVEAWRDDWMKWARKEIRLLREALGK